MKKTDTKNWHSLESEAVIKDLETSPEIGLTEEEVFLRQQKYGKNIHSLPTKAKVL